MLWRMLVGTSIAGLVWLALRSPAPSRAGLRIHLIRGVISAGNTNFGEHFCIAGDIISRKCHVPHLYRLEVFGTPEDVERVSEGLERWQTLQ